MKRVRGSLALEAVISFTVFTSFMFMLLLVVKMSMTAIALDSVTSEVAKEIATNSYPIGIFNKMVDEKIVDSVESYEEGTGFLDDLTDTSTKGIIEYITAPTKKSSDKANNNTALGIIGIPLRYGMDKLGEVVVDAVTELIGKKGNEFVRSNIAQGIEDYNVGIDLEKLRLEVCKFPVPKANYSNGYTSENFTKMGLTKGDFEANDVVIGLTYDYELALPFLPTFNIKLKSIAIERAWVNGGNGESVSPNEGIDIAKGLFGEKHYYVGAGNTSKKYHKANCFTLYRGKTAITAAEAASYGPCAICKPGKIE